MENLTLNRLALGNNLLVNPFFEHVEWPADLPVVSHFKDTLRYAPGWFDFGWVSSGTVEVPGGVPPLTPGLLGSAGVKIKHYSGVGYPRGLCQLIPRAQLIKNRKVRVCGAYRVVTNDTGNRAGISVWLVGKVNNQAITSTTRYSGAAGNILPNTRLTDAGSDFTAAGVVVGDVIRVEHPISGAFEYRRITVVAPGGDVTKVDVSPAFSFTGAGVNWEVDALHTWCGQGRVYLSDDDSTGAPMHVISFSSKSPAGYSLNEELLNRAYDSLDVDDVDGTDKAVFINTGDETNPDTWPTTKQNGKVFFLGNEWTGVPADGNFELYSNSTSSSDTQYFETVLDIPNVSALFNDGDAWIVVMPVQPSDLGSTDADIEVRIRALTLEIVADPAEGAQGRLEAMVTASQTPGPTSLGGGYPLNYLMRYPIYVPHIYPLDVHVLPDGLDLIQNTGVSIYRYAHLILGQNSKWEVSSPLDGSDVEDLKFSMEQVHVPPGSVLVEARFNLLGTAGASGNFSPVLEQILGSIPGDGEADPSLQTLASIDIALPDTGEFDLDVERNKIGLYWPSGAGDELQDYGFLGASRVLFRFAAPAYASDPYSVTLANGFMVFLVDPRWGSALWKREV